MQIQFNASRRASTPCNRLHVEPRFFSIEVEGLTLAASGCALRIEDALDANGPDLFLPKADIDEDILRQGILRPANRGRACPRIGLLHYWSLAFDGMVLDRAARVCERPNAGYSRLRDHIVFDIERLKQVTQVRTRLH